MQDENRNLRGSDRGTRQSPGREALGTQREFPDVEVLSFSLRQGAEAKYHDIPDDYWVQKPGCQPRVVFPMISTSPVDNLLVTLWRTRKVLLLESC
jgi:hypothetical protein